MAIFSTLYERVMQWAKHPQAQIHLAVLSFAESSFFPIPPDVMLAPMCLANRQRAWWYAFLTTTTSVLGGIFGYIIGMFFFALVHPLLVHFGYWDTYLNVQHWFGLYDFWIIFLAGFSPLPYKVFTIAAGTMHIAIIPFIIASIIGRGARFFLVALLIVWGGEPMEKLLRRYVDRIGWATVAVLVIGIILYYFY